MEQLWKKQISKNGDTLYADILQKPRNDRLIQTKVAVEERKFFEQLNDAANQKDNQLSTEHRKKGNIKFTEGRWLDAMELYNDSLCFAQIGTECVSLALGNRSACFFQLKMYGKCLIDIKLAKEAKYPETKMSKLDRRKEECLKLQETVESCDEFEPKLSFDEDEHYPGMANVLQIQYNKAFGRCIMAKCDIEAGKTILIEEPFVSSLKSNKWKHCHTCSKSSMNFISCGQCTSFMFCNKACMERNNFHKIECECVGITLLDIKIQHIHRSIFAAINTFSNIESLMEFVEDVVSNQRKELPSSTFDPKSKYRSILKLNVFMSSLHRKVFLPEAYTMYKTFMCFPSMAKLFDSKRKQHFLMHLIGQHICSINSNIYGGHYTYADEKCEYFSSYVLQSYYNHSCIANVTHFINGNRTICTTTRPVKKGEQLFLYYLGYMMRDRQSKNEYLSENFGFSCRCEQCMNDEWSDGMVSNMVQIQSDPTYQYLFTEFQQNEKSIINNDNKEMCSRLKKLCIALLNKYGHLYADSSPVGDIFGKLLEIEANGRLVDLG